MQGISQVFSCISTNTYFDRDRWMALRDSMGEIVNIISMQHTSAKRDYLERMMSGKVECMQVARQYDEDYWDGARKYG